MPIKPPPIKLRCPQCSWSQVFAPQSDVWASEIPRKCPRCNNSKLTVTTSNAVETLIATISNLLK